MPLAPHFDPIAVSFGPFHIGSYVIGPLAVRWYGLMYVLAFIMVLVLGRLRIRRRGGPIDERGLDDLLFYGMLGTVLGGRIGYVLFYQPHRFLTQPADIIRVWEGGMSFHGGLIGVSLAMLWFARTRAIPFFAVSDFVSPLVPLGLAAGRLGNFINGELWGRPTDLPWGMIFADDPTQQIRHPSQLYELGLEGIVLFTLVWLYSGKPRPMGAVTGVFVAGYGCARFIGEFAREPDSFLGYLQLGMTMGQWLSLPMIIVGVAVYLWSMRRARSGAVVH